LEDLSNLSQNHAVILQGELVTLCVIYYVAQDVVIVFRRVRRNAENDCYLGHVCPFVCIEQLSSNWRNLRDIWYLGTSPNLSRKFKFH